jgi:hypothetical protein
MIPAVITEWQEHQAKYGTDNGPLVSTSVEYLLYDTMFEWKISPDKFEKLHPTYQAFMIAYVAAKRAREAYITNWYEEKHKKK